MRPISDRLSDPTTRLILLLLRMNLARHRLIPGRLRMEMMPLSLICRCYRLKAVPLGPFLGAPLLGATH